MMFFLNVEKESPAQPVSLLQSRSNRLMISKEEDNDSRCIQLSLRYRFNVTPSKYKGTGAGNAEKNRL